MRPSPALVSLSAPNSSPLAATGHRVDAAKEGFEDFWTRSAACTSTRSTSKREQVERRRSWRQLRRSSQASPRARDGRPSRTVSPIRDTSSTAPSSSNPDGFDEAAVAAASFAHPLPDWDFESQIAPAKYFAKYQQLERSSGQRGDHGFRGFRWF